MAIDISIPIKRKWSHGLLFLSMLDKYGKRNGKVHNRQVKINFPQRSLNNTTMKGNDKYALQA